MSALSLLMPAARAQADTSLAGVHWYSGDSSLLDLTVPAGERGYNVEVIFDAGWCDGNPSTDPGGVRSVAATAKAHGLVNIIRVDYRQLLAVPTNPGEYGSWAANFIKCTQELSDLSSLFIVGNEPNIEDGGRPEGDIRSDEYASAFNYLYARKADLPAGTQLLATFDSPFTSPAWMLDMSSRLIGVDGFALHTGGVRTGCRDPRQPCSFGGWSFDGAFRYYRDVIANINSGWWSRPVYITEFNTYTGEPGSEPDRNYPPDWINQAFEEIRNYNATRGARPLVKALCWFVDRPQSWPKFSLRNLAAARADMGEEFKNPANRGGGGTCTRGRPRVQYAREYWVVDSRASLAQFQEIVRQAYPSRVTVGFSYDDAGIGDLDTRKVVVWGDEFDRNVLLDWYRQNYGGVSVEFRALPGQGSWRFGPYATSAPAGCRGRPRAQYAREYWVIDSRASLATLLGVAGQAYGSRRQTVGFSYDDAGIGDLDQRQVVVWGSEFDPNVLRQWYNQFYPGATLSFRGLPVALIGPGLVNGTPTAGPAGASAASDCTRGRPRVQYAREYWVVDSRASLGQVQEIVRQAYPSRVTVGFSYDDAGIGDLDTRKVVVWGDEFDRNVLLDWYRQNYGGVSVEFRALPGQGSWRFGPYATPAPAGCRGEPRIQYAREYWVIDSRAPLPTVLGIAEQAYRDRRQTVGFSYDDAGIGDLDQRQVVVWGNEFDPSVLRQWYAQFYPGVTLTFRGSDRIERRVVVLSYDPVNPTNPAEHLSNRLGTADVFEHSQRIADAIRAASGFMADYQIVETHRIDKFPVKRDGFRYTWDGYLACHGNAANCHSPDDASYRPMMNGEDAGTDLCGRIASGQIDEVWLWGFGWFGLDEFAYKIPNDQPLFQPRPYNYWIYDGRKKDLPVCGRTYFVMGYNHERQEGRGLHSFGHRMESALIASPVGQGLWQRCGSTQYGSSDWTDFTCIERDAPGRAGCGDVHNPPNATQDYDYANPTPVTSQCDDWFNYPNRTGATTTVSYSTWGRAPWGSDEDGYFTWWMNHVPRKPGGGAALYNWWHYILCYDRTCR